MPIIQMTTYKISTPGPTPTGPTLIADWKLNGNLNDSSGNGYTLTNAGNASFTTDSAISRTVLSCSGVKNGDSYVYIQSLPSSSTDEITFHIWCKGLTGFQNARGLFATRVTNIDGNNDGIRWETYNNNLYFYIGEDYPNHQDTISVSITSGELTSWGLWTVTYNKSDLSYAIYRNATLKTSGTSNYNPSSSWLSNFTLGIGYATIDDYFNRSYYGYIGETSLYDGVMSGDEVKSYYNDTCSTYGLSPRS